MSVVPGDSFERQLDIVSKRVYLDDPEHDEAFIHRKAESDRQ